MFYIINITSDYTTTINKIFCQKHYSQRIVASKEELHFYLFLLVLHILLQELSISVLVQRSIMN